MTEHQPDVSAAKTAAPQTTGSTPLPAPAGLTPMPLGRFLEGDRRAAAEYIAKNAPLIRRRLRGKIARSLRSLFDSDDLMATVTRRLDDIIRRQELMASSEGELWSLLDHLATNALRDLARRAMRERPGPTADAAPSRQAPHEDPPGEADGLLDLCLTGLRSDVDQRILRMRMQRLTHAQIAAAEGVPEATVRKRWQRIRGAIRAMLGLPSRPRASGVSSARRGGRD